MRSRFWQSWPDQRARHSFQMGFREVGPALVATSMWAFVTGIALVNAGLTQSMAALMTLLVYAGSAQLTALPLLVGGAPLWLVFAAACVVNLRFVIFGAALQPFFRKYPWFQRLALGYWSSDIVFVLFMTRYGDAKHKGTRTQLWYYLGVIVPGFVSWQVCSMLGIYLGAIIPAAWSLDFAAILALMAITIPLVTSFPMVASLLAAGLIAWYGQILPLRLGLVAAVVGGVVAGVVADACRKRKPR